MVRDPPEHADTGALGRVSADHHLFVIGTSSDGHADACRELAARQAVDTPLRVCADASPGGRILGATDPYESGGGNHAGLDLGEAGLVATESIANLAVDDGTQTGVHLCVDGLPVPRSPDTRRILHRFLFTVTRAIGRYGGGCHVHLDVDPGSRDVDTFAPIFDTVVELREPSTYRLGAWDTDAGPERQLTGRPDE